MKVHLAYGRDGLDLNLPTQAVVLRSANLPGLAEPGSAGETAVLQEALRRPIQSPPLGDLVREGDRVMVTHSDLTRATPNRRILPVLLAELEAGGVRRADITLLNALGTHRPQTEAELRALLGDFIVDHYRCEQHNAWAEDLASFGVTARGHPVRINRRYAEADVRILTGFIEPHFFAGFSGGPKGVLPALAGAESVTTNHGVAMIAHPQATWGVTTGNPIWEEMREVALRTRPTFILNVTLNEQRQLTGIFAGDLLAAHAAGCEIVRRQALIPVEEPFDVVLTSNSGYPLDQNLYQCVKGMAAARRVARRGGAILMAAACEDGIPAHGRYAELLAAAGSPQGILEMLAQPGFSAQDQWQVQTQANIQQHAEVFVYSQGLTEGEIRAALFHPCPDLGDGLEDLLRRYGSRLGVLPQGPETIPTLK